MKYQNVFKRYEVKYLITRKQQKIILQAMENLTVPDKYGKSTICNLYFDTPDYLLIRRSIEKPVYKEKLRLRTYGMAHSDTQAFAEIKKKYKSVVYKRRVDMPYSQALNYLKGKGGAPGGQINSEIEYFLQFYENLAPRVFISYERQAFYSKDDPDFRMTFDQNILWRDYDLDLTKGIYGNKILQDNMVLLEVKTKGAIPLWLTAVLIQNKIYKTSFSKYGNAYKEIFYRKQEVKNYA